MSKRVLVVGMVRSGLAAARLLAARGFLPVLNDLKPREELAGLEVLEGLICEWALGVSPEGLLEGLDFVVISPGVPVQSPWIEKARGMGIPVIGELELGASYARGPQAAITGTNGKTTTTSLLGEMLKADGRVTHVVGNIGDPISGAALEAREGDSYAIEVSSFQLETVRDFHPQVAALLNLTPDHLNRHGDMETYGAMKMRIYQNQTEADYLVYNGDDPACVDMARGARSRKLAFSRRGPVEQGAFAQDGKIHLRLDGEQGVLCGTEEVRIPGPHNLENALAAVCMAWAMGVSKEAICQALREFGGVAHRLETVRVWHGIRFINDSMGSNVVATSSAIASMDAPTVMILGGDDKGVSFDALAKTLVQQPNIVHAVLIGKTAGKIRQALEQAGYGAYHEAGFDFEKAMAMAVDLAEEGGNVLLSPACASFDMFRDYAHRGGEFRRIVMALE